MISVKGGSGYVTKKEQWYIKDLCEFIAEKFFTKRLREKLEINVKLSNYLRDEGFLGDCVWEDQHYKPREFTLNIDREGRIAQILNTVAHEMVHVKQMAKGEFYQLMRKPSGIHKFNGRTLDQNKIDYWDQPWEIEAHGRAIGLVNQWARDRNFSSSVCNKIILD
jgi:hypothetical protein